MQLKVENLCPLTTETKILLDFASPNETKSFDLTIEFSYQRFKRLEPRTDSSISIESFYRQHKSSCQTGLYLTLHVF